MVPLCHGASLLVHEATDSHISSAADQTGKLSKRTPEMVQERALARGHSVPEMAGDFARRIGAKALVLNHIGMRYVFLIPSERSLSETSTNLDSPLLGTREILRDSTSCKISNDMPTMHGHLESNALLLMIICALMCRSSFPMISHQHHHILWRIQSSKV